MLNRYCRNFARDDDVRITDHSLVRIRDSIHDYLDARGAHCTSPPASAATSPIPAKTTTSGKAIVIPKEGGDSLVNPVVCDGIYGDRSSNKLK